MINTLQPIALDAADIRIFHIDWKHMKSSVSGEFYPTRQHAGKNGMVNSGVLAALLDEALTILSQSIEENAVNSELKIHFHKHARIGEKLTIKAQLGISRHGELPAVVQIRNASGRLVATAAGKALKNEDHT